MWGERMKELNSEIGCSMCGKTARVHQGENYNKELPKGWVSNPELNNAICDECSHYDLVTIIRSCQINIGYHRYSNMKYKEIRDCCNIDIKDLTQAISEKYVRRNDGLRKK